MKAIIILLIFSAPLVLHAQKTVISPQLFYYDPKDTASMKALMRNKSVKNVCFQAIDTNSILFKLPCKETDSIDIKKKTSHMPSKDSIGGK